MTLVVVIVAVCFVTCISAGPIMNFLCKQDAVLAELDAGHSHTITIYGKTCSEIGRPVRYEISANGKVIFAKSMFTVDDGTHNRYSLVTAENKALVGVLDIVTSPPELVIIYDATSNSRWPVFYVQAGSRTWHDAVLRLQQENPQLSMPLLLK